LAQVGQQVKPFLGRWVVERALGIQAAHEIRVPCCDVAQREQFE
jgi:hypothetical protein